MKKTAEPREMQLSLPRILFGTPSSAVIALEEEKLKLEPIHDMPGEKAAPVILIVDDQPVSLKMLLAFLERRGFSMLVATGGEEALAMIAKTRPDIILMDIMMPVLDGYETCRLLKDKEETADIPVIFITALTRLEDKVKGFDAGGVDYVTKPFRQEEVLARVTTHLNLSRLRKELESKNRQLHAVLAEVRQLSGILPLCAKCKKKRDDDDYWQQVDTFLKSHTGVDFSHGCCPDCHADELSGLGELQKDPS